MVHAVCLKAKQIIYKTVSSKAARKQSTFRQKKATQTNDNMKTIISLVFLIFFGTLTEAQIYYVQDMTTIEIEALDREKTIVLLPGGILEEHGPYLPSFSDGYMNEALTLEIANSIIKRPNWNVLIFPIIPLGTGGANEIGGKYSYSGTYAIRQNTLRAIFMDLGSELGEQGFKMVFVIHIHGSANHNQAIDQAAEFFAETYHGRMINIWNLAFRFSPDLKNEEEKKEDGFGVHAGMNETSILLYLKPETIKSEFKDAEPVTAYSSEGLVSKSKENGWQGYLGSPRLSSSTFGEKYWKGWVNYIIDQVENIIDNKYDFSSPTFYEIELRDPAFNSFNKDAKKHERENEVRQNEWLEKKGYDQ